MQPACQFCNERTARRRLRARHVGDGQHQALGVAFDDVGQAVGPLLGHVAIAPIDDDAGANAAQVLDQCQPEHDRDRPQFTKTQWCDGLVGDDETAQAFLINATVAVRDGVERQVIDAGQTHGRATGQTWQFATVALGQMPPCDAYLLFDHVDVVEQPLARRRQRALPLCGIAQPCTSLVDDIFVVAQTMQQLVVRRYFAHVMGVRKGLAVTLHALGAEQLRAQRRLGVQRFAFYRPTTTAQPGAQRHQRA